MSQDPLVIFVHIPKTGGITMMQILTRQYGQEGWFGTAWGPGKPKGAARHIALYVGVKLKGDIWYPEPLERAASRFLALSNETRARIGAIRGHTSFGLDRHLPQPAAYFTMLRQPADQVLSGYFFVTDFERRPGGMSVYEHLSSLPFRRNLQTLMLAGPYADDADALPPPDEMLERAKRNLRACAVVGLTERFDETMLLLKKAFGWRWPLYVRANVNRRRPPRSAIPPETVHRIESDNALDVALYAHAQELFEEQVRAYGPSFKRDLRVFCTLNLAWQRWHSLGRFARRVFRAIDRRIWPLFEPLYAALARWGGLRRLLPPRLAPRVAAPQVSGKPRYRVYVGKRLAGQYKPRWQRWVIRRPYHLFVDESALSGSYPPASQETSPN